MSTGLIKVNSYNQHLVKRGFMLRLADHISRQEDTYDQYCIYKKKKKGTKEQQAKSWVQLWVFGEFLSNFFCKCHVSHITRMYWTVCQGCTQVLQIILVSKSKSNQKLIIVNKCYYCKWQLYIIHFSLRNARNL